MAKYLDPLKSARSLKEMDSPNKSGRTIEELREDREYDVRVVNEYVGKVTDTTFLAPGASMSLFVACCTNTQLQFPSLNRDIRIKIQQLYLFFRDAEPWTQTNILYKWREWIYHESSLRYIRAYSSAARRKDQIKECEDGARQGTETT